MAVREQQTGPAVAGGTGQRGLTRRGRTASGAVRFAPRGGGGGGSESTLTVVVALTANALIAVLKAVAAVLSGSAAMAAEAAHSVADTVNEVLLLTALKRSGRPADREHPFGYGQQRYFWALVAAGSIFVTGALYSAYEGVEAITGESGDAGSPVLNYVVLGISFLLEGTSLVRGVLQTRSGAAEHRLSFREFLARSDDPTATTVVFEDSAALVGLLLAAGGVALRHATGSALWDGLASLLIAAVLAVVAFRLARTNMRLLTGAQADPRVVRAMLVWLGDRPEVDAVVDLLTLTLGTDQVLVCARLDVVDDLTSGELERAVVRIGRELQEEFPDAVDVFLEPVPRGDAGVRDRVRDRYGDELATEMVEEAASSPQP